jgi:hypothetical protein
MLKKLLKGVAVISTGLFLLLASFIWYAKAEEKQLSGLNTQVVEISNFNVITGKLAITNANILSASGNSILPNRTILIRESTIESILEDSIIPN